MVKKCEYCEVEEKDRELYDTTEYSSAFDDKGRDVTVCEDCESEGNFWCQECNRLVSESCGHNLQYRIVNQELTCLKCYEEQILKEGQDEEDFEGEGISGGMFFSYGNEELIKAGFTHFRDFFITGKDSAKEYNNLAREKIEDGCKLITAYERLSIIGNEGTIGLWIKK